MKMLRKNLHKNKTVIQSFAHQLRRWVGILAIGALPLNATMADVVHTGTGAQSIIGAGPYCRDGIVETSYNISTLPTEFVSILRDLPTPYVKTYSISIQASNVTEFDTEHCDYTLMTEGDGEYITSVNITGYDFTTSRSSTAELEITYDQIALEAVALGVAVSGSYKVIVTSEPK